MANARVLATATAFDQVGDLLMFCTGRREVPDGEISDWIARMGRHDFEYLLISVRGDAGLSSRQRGKIGDFWKGAPRKAPPMALVSDSRVARLISTGLSWITGSDARAFAGHELEAALSYLGTRAPLGEVRASLEAMHAHLLAPQTAARGVHAPR